MLKRWEKAIGMRKWFNEKKSSLSHKINSKVKEEFQLNKEKSRIEQEEEKKNTESEKEVKEEEEVQIDTSSK